MSTVLILHVWRSTKLAQAMTLWAQALSEHSVISKLITAQTAAYNLMLCFAAYNRLHSLPNLPQVLCLNSLAAA